ncbi:MAG: dTMP kinase [Deltaproteobacteria bacterium]|nr:dTMP kinase [Deltaproteobacteria bacterium]
MGFFITFEGIEGCGKTTQAELLKGYLEKKGKEVLKLREPGGTALGEKVRAILLNSEAEPIDPWAELFLYEACRAQIVSNVIRKALDAGKIVICDRFTDSTTAYQGYGRGLDVGSIASLNEMAAGGLKPGLTILVDCDPEVGLKRAWSRIEVTSGAKEDRFEKEDIIFHKKVREGFLKIAAQEPQRVRVVRGEAEIPSIHKEICDIIEKMGF